MGEYTSTKKITKRMDFHPTVFIQVDRISKFNREMNHYSAKDILKLESMIKDLESDLAFHIRMTQKEKKITLRKLGTLKARIRKIDLFEHPEKYVNLLLDLKAEIIYLAGMAEILPTYKEGMARETR